MKYDVIIIGGGLSGMTAGVALLEKGLNVACLAGGGTLHQAARQEYIDKGGEFFRGDYAVDGIWDGNSLTAVRSRNFGQMPLYADRFLLATGKFFSGGLVSDRSRIYEPVFGLDVRYDEDRSLWFNEDFFAPQPFESYGVLCDDDMRALRSGTPVDNLYVAGEILFGVSAVNNFEEITASALRAAAKIRL